MGEVIERDDCGWTNNCKIDGSYGLKQVFISYRGSESDEAKKKGIEMHLWCKKD